MRYKDQCDRFGSLRDVQTPPRTYEVQTICGDATNSPALGVAVRKAQAVSVDSLFHFGPDSEDAHIESWPDVQKVALRFDSVVARALFSKQCASIGLRSWLIESDPIIISPPAPLQ